MRIFDLETKELIHNFKQVHNSKYYFHFDCLTLFLGAITCVTVSGDGKYIFSASDDKSIKMLRLEGKTEEYHWKDAHESMHYLNTANFILKRRNKKDRSLKG